MVSLFINYYLFSFLSTKNRSIGLHREAEMIEQQLKMKQGAGQMPMTPGKFKTKKKHEICEN